MSRLGGKECHNPLVTFVQRCGTGVTPIAGVRRQMGWEDNHVWSWNPYVDLWKRTNQFSNNESVSVGSPETAPLGELRTQRV